MVAEQNGHRAVGRGVGAEIGPLLLDNGGYGLDGASLADSRAPTLEHIGTLKVHLEP